MMMTMMIIIINYVLVHIMCLLNTKFSAVHFLSFNFKFCILNEIVTRNSILFIHTLSLVFSSFPGV